MNANKGRSGEYKFRDLLNEALGEFGYKADRVGMAEANKKTLFGDVVVFNDPHKRCFLSDYFLEAKNQKAPSPFAVLKQAEENAEQYGKHGSICFVRRAKGSGVNAEEMIIMTPETFKRLTNSLQSLIEKSYE
jgi:hypothetical protein